MQRNPAQCVAPRRNRLDALVDDRGDGLDLDELIIVAEHGHPEQRADHIRLVEQTVYDDSGAALGFATTALRGDRMALFSQASASTIPDEAEYAVDQRHNREDFESLT